MAKSSNYLQRHEKAIEEIAEKYGIETKEAEELIDQFFLDMKSSITDERMPTIKITNLGTFGPSMGKLEWQRKHASYHLKKGECTESKKEKLKEKITKLQVVKERLEKEKRGEETWKEWRNKKL